MKWSLNVGKLAGTKILLHWTFILLIFYIGISQLFQGNSLEAMLFSVGSILAVFVCVVLHEFGHILTARKFGINTKRIILLPIGGLADLERIPENPKQEILIALAGPAVNVVIAMILYIVSPVNEILAGTTNIKTLNSYQLFWSGLFSINLMLFIFNMIPAFPMDGGRVLRAILALTMNRIKATRIAANIGQFIAILFVFGGLFFNPLLSLVGVFIFLAAYSENFLIQHQEFLRGFVARDAMMTKFSIIHPKQNIKEVSDKVLEGTETDFIVSDDGLVLGLVTYPLLIQALKENKWNTPVEDIMLTEVEPIKADEHLDVIFTKLQRNKNSILPVIDNQKIAGIINLNNINEFLMIRSAVH